MTSIYVLSLLRIRALVLLVPMACFAFCRDG